MHWIKVAAGVLNQTPLGWDGNQERIVAACRDARRQDVSILCLPELCITGYGCEDAFQSPGVQAQAWRVLEALEPESAGMVVSVGLPVLYHDMLFNCVAVLADGRLVGLVAKQFLAGDGIHYEPRWFKAWAAGQRGWLQRGERRVPIGDLYFDCGGVRIGFEICEDAWVANRPGGELAQRGVDVILNPSASHFAFGKTEIRRRFVLEGSRAFGVAYVYSNLLGNEAGRAIYDGDAMIASGGRLAAWGPRFSFADWRLVSAAVDVDLARMNRARLASARSLPEIGGVEGVAVPFRWPAVLPAPADAAVAITPGDDEWERGPHVKEEEFARAVRLGLFDYLRKSASRGFVVSLSGGADSSATACLCAMMVEAALAELGLEGFRRKLEHIPDLPSVTEARAHVGRLLACVYQATRNSSDVTLNAARGLAEDLGARFLHLDVDATAAGYVDMVSAALGRKLDWATDDVALQNIQARVRSPSAWLIANLQNALLLSTSNRSEAAVGYATMDGDTSGGLSPLAGIDKAYLRRWLQWLETIGPQGGRPIPALHAVNVQAPTAELRPREQGQTDEADLMPYELLDAIERLAIRDKRTPLETFQLLRPRFEYEPRQLAVWIERFFRLWSRNQWKRERYAPSFHLDDENLDPKTWCRFPILSGGFRRELAELRQYVDAAFPPA